MESLNVIQFLANFFSILAVTGGLIAWLWSRLDKKFDAVDKRFEAVDRKFEAVDKKFEAVDKKFEAVDKKFETLNTKIDEIKTTNVEIKVYFDIMKEKNAEQNAQKASEKTIQGVAETIRQEFKKLNGETRDVLKNQ